MMTPSSTAIIKKEKREKKKFNKNESKNVEVIKDEKTKKNVTSFLSGCYIERDGRERANRMRSQFEIHVPSTYAIIPTEI